MEDTDVKPLSPSKDADDTEESKASTPEKETPVDSEAARSVKINFSEKESGKKTEPLANQKSDENEDTDAERDEDDQEGSQKA